MPINKRPLPAAEGEKSDSSTPPPSKKSKVADRAKAAEKAKAAAEAKAAAKAKAAEKVNVANAARLRAATEAAVRDNPPGVRIVIVGSLDMTPLLAGYLNVPDTQALRDLITEITNSDSCKAWCDARKVGFGVNGLGATSVWAIKTLFKFACDPSFLDEEDFEGGLPLNIQRWPAKDSTRGYASWLVTMWTIIQAYPDSFTSTTSEETEKSYLAGIHVEDWHRAYQVLRVIWREKNESRSSLKSTGVTRSKVQTKPAQVPTFYTDADLRGAGTDEAAKLTTGNLELEQYLEDEEEGAAEAEDETEQSPAAGGKEEAAVFDVFEASFKNVPTNLDEINKKNWMPQLDFAAKGQLLAHIGKRAKVLWPLEDVQKASAKPAAGGGVGSSAETQTQTAKSLVEPITSTFAERTVQDADVEGTAFPGEMEQEDRERFWKLQRTMNNVSSNPVDYAQACIDLDLDPSLPMIGNLTLKPWQVTGAWWILWQWRWGLGSVLLSDDVGLGKTITTLTALQIGAQLASTPLSEHTLDLSPRLGLEPPYKPTLIVCPASAFAVWKEELTHFPHLHLHLWAGSSLKAEVRDRYRTLETHPEAVIELAASLSPEDPATACQIILTTYQTFHMRTLRFEDVPTPNSKGKGRRVIEEEDDEDQVSQELDDDDDQELSEEQLRRLKTAVEGVFGIIIADESHKLKSVRTRTHQAVSLVLPSNILLISATPTINRSIDLYGSLALIWRCMRPGLIDNLRFDYNDPPRMKYGDFKAALEMFDKLTPVNLLDIRQFIVFLYPQSFLAIANKERQLSTSTAAHTLPLILSLIQLRRVKGQEIGVLGSTVVIGGDIPPYSVMTVELEMSLEEYHQYLAIHERLSNRLAAGGWEGEGEGASTEGHINMAAHRLLSHVSLHPGLDHFCKSKRTSTAKVVTWNERKDYGYTFFHRLTRMDTTAPPYRERVGAALSISAGSVKLQWLASKVFDVCIGKRNNLIVFIAWPTTQWLVEMFLTTIGIPVLSIRAAHSRMQRSMTQELFNNPATKGHVLVTSLKCGATSMNLQKNCACVVFLEVPDSANLTAQAIGRVHRIGQKEQQEIYIVSKNHSYDQKLQANAAQKMYGQIAGQSDLSCTEDEIERARQELARLKGAVDVSSDDDSDDGSNADSPIERAALKRAKHGKVVALYMATFGQRTPRHNWDNVRALAAKDLLPSEAIPGKMICRKSPTYPS